MQIEKTPFDGLLDVPSESSDNFIHVLMKARFWSELEELELYNFCGKSIIYLLNNRKLCKLRSLRLKTKDVFDDNFEMTKESSVRSLEIINSSQSLIVNLAKILGFFPMLTNLKMCMDSCELESFNPIIFSNLRRLEINCKKTSNEEKILSQLTQMRLLTNIFLNHVKKQKIFFLTSIQNSTVWYIRRFAFNAENTKKYFS